MRNNIKALWPYILTVIFWLLFLFVVFGFSACNQKLKRENEQLREELARQQQYVPLKKDTIRDTIEVVTQKVVEVEKIKEVLSKDDKELIKDLSMKVSELESYQKVSNVIHDTITLTVKDTSTNTLYYKDAWAEFEYQNRHLRYSVKDSLAIALKREYKHKFLWWKWGVKGYELKAVNFNPHSSIKYNTYIRRRND